MAAICAKLNNKLIYKHIHDFGVYCRVFMYARDSSVARKYIRHFIIDNIKHTRYSRSNSKLISYSTEKNKFTIFVSTIGFSGLVVSLESTLDNALLVKSKIAALSASLKTCISISTDKQFQSIFKDQR